MRKVLEYIENSNGRVTPKEISDKLNINQKEVDTVFLWLIDNDKVIDYSSKQGIMIERKRGIDYSSIHREIRPSMNIKTKITLTITILTFIVFVVINWDKIVSVFN